MKTNPMRRGQSVPKIQDERLLSQRRERQRSHVSVAVHKAGLLTSSG